MMYELLARRSRDRRNRREFDRALQSASPTMREELLAARARQRSNSSR